MASVQTVQRRFMVILAVLLVLDAAAIALLLSPVGRSRQERIQEYERVRTELMAKRRDALPARDMDQKLKTARTEIDEFYKDRLPQRYSDVTDTLGRLAKDAHVQLGGVRYDTRENDRENQLPGLDRLHIEAQVSGEYANEMRFINAVERDKMLFILDSVNLGEQAAAQGGTQGGVKLQMKLETYLRNQ